MQLSAWLLAERASRGEDIIFVLVTPYYLRKAALSLQPEASELKVDRTVFTLHATKQEPLHNGDLS